MTRKKIPEKEDSTKNLEVPFNLRERPKIRGERLLRGETLFTVLMNLILFIFITILKYLLFIYNACNIKKR